ncbi:hypothetical protein ACFQWB_10690 [Paenibacillus thermoaerophilus]|uniref:Copper amine oxidase N-terminal domain-containing protein n=1 Tax=Paenibacillus thermoaerophilus TaxID=1215385 RepID=A0ABW2V2M2_9BACL|nr:hypothetical protein [Paenibacillus thermoaerophilus]TMV18766.1 hypothetical protein FE781_02205 [Paenibacillus thermoaerophilus]
MKSKWKPIATIALALSLAGTGVVYAASWRDTAVGVSVNGSRVSFGDGVGAHLVEGSVVLPLRKMADSLLAMVSWQSGEAKIYRPNVHLVVAEEVTREGDSYTIEHPFGKISQGSRKKFTVFAQIDGLRTDIESFRLRVLTPGGAVADDSGALQAGSSVNNFWSLYGFKVDFDSAGEYKVQMLMKLPGEAETVVAEKAILCE